MKLSEVMRSAGVENTPRAATILKNFPEECEVLLNSYDDGDFIFRENDPIVYVGILVQGRCTCSWDISGRDDYVHISSELPSTMGDQAVLAGLSHYTGTFRAIGKCKAALVRVPDFWLWMERDPEYYKAAAARHIRILLAQCQTRRSTVVDRSDIRVIKYLVWYCQVKCGASSDKPPGPVTVRVTREAMTEAIGQISLRTVNRILSRMEKEDLIDIRKGKIYIRSEQYLQMAEILDSYIGEI